jgi:cytochrome b561
MSDAIDQTQRAVDAAKAVRNGLFGAALLFMIVTGTVALGVPGAVVTPLVGYALARIVWRRVMPDDPHPAYGALAGALCAAGALVVFISGLAVVVFLTESSNGSVAGVWEAVVTFLGYGALFTFPFALPIGAFAGYSQEKELARDEQE